MEGEVLNGNDPANLTVIYDPALGHHRLDPYPTEEGVGAYYEGDHFYAEHSPPDWFEKERTEYKAGLWDSYYEYLLRITLSEIPGRELHRFGVDVGCGLGTFLNYWENSDHRGHIFGIEPSLEARIQAENLSYSSEFGKHPYDIYKNWAESEYDAMAVEVISIMLTLEHVINPGMFLRELTGRLRRGGRVLVVVPNDLNPLQERLNYFGFISPVHVNYFTPKTLRGVMEDAGLKIIHEGATFPMELFPLAGINYFGKDALGRRCHRLRLAWEKLLGWRVFEVYKKLYDRWGIGRELIFIGEK